MPDQASANLHHDGLAWSCSCFRNVGRSGAEPLDKEYLFSLKHGIDIAFLKKQLLWPYGENIENRAVGRSRTRDPGSGNRTASARKGAPGVCGESVGYQGATSARFPLCSLYCPILLAWEL